MGSTISITVEITANHLGYFEFRLCENNDVTKKIAMLAIVRAGELYPLHLCMIVKGD